MAITQQYFVWRDLDLGRGDATGLELHYNGRKLLTLVPDETHPQLYRIQYPDGWSSPAANITRAKDAAYGHARYLLAGQRHAEGACSHEIGVQGGGL